MISITSRIPISTTSTGPLAPSTSSGCAENSAKITPDKHWEYSISLMPKLSFVSLPCALYSRIAEIDDIIGGMLAVTHLQM
jgi:hypothetical protein